MTSADLWNLRLSWLLFALLAALLSLHLRVHWTENAQYSFGALVPFLGAYLLYQRWETRPNPAPSIGEVFSWLALPLALLFLPLWLVAQPNPDWRMLSWLLVGNVVALMLLGWGIAGGWRWLRHFAFPVCFIATAVPLPHGIEAPVIQGMMQLVASITVTAVNLLGIPALQHGNVIETSAGLLGVDEACSGVRSLQAALMAALFLGELYRFDLARRLALIASAVGLALLTNTIRAFFLTWQSAQHGTSAVDRWHDPAGYSIMLACFVGLWGISRLIDNGQPRPVEASLSSSARFLPVGALVALVVWFTLVLAGTEWWFRSSGPAPDQQWTFSWPQTRTDFQPATITAETAALLKYDAGAGAGWKDDAGTEWLAFNFIWSPGPSRSRLLARMHRPQNCLPATGWRMTHAGETLTVPVGPWIVPFEVLTFQYGSQVANIWFCTWEDRRPGASPSLPSTTTAQRAGIEAVLRRERNLGQQVLQIVRFGEISPEAANAAFLREIAPLLNPAAEKSD
jgi:exosortase